MISQRLTLPVILMKTLNRITFLTVIILISGISVSHAQFRNELNRSRDFTGPVVKEGPNQAGNLGNLFNMKMDHSYSMMFSSIGGQFQNLNAYTNTMRFFFSERMTGRLDISLLHSPFGNNSFINTNGNNGLGADVIIRNAELNYQLSENSNIRIQFQQLPSYGYGYGAGPWSPYYNSPFGNSNF